MRQTTPGLLLALLLLPCARVTGQTAYEPVEEGVADVDPLAAGLRQLQIDLRTPSGFERVYRVPGREDLLMRIDGGLFAIFPRSVYADTRLGRVPVIPNNTVYFIGAPPADAAALATLGLGGGASAAALAAPGPMRRDRLGFESAAPVAIRAEARSRPGARLDRHETTRIDARLDLRVMDSAASGTRGDPPAGTGPTRPSPMPWASGPAAGTQRRAAASPPARGDARVPPPDSPADPERTARVRELMRRAAAGAARGG